MRRKDKNVLDRNCHYCSRRMLSYRENASKEERLLMITTDHIVPKLLGGPDEDTNYVYACSRCNVLKGTLPYEVFKTFANMVLKELSFQHLPIPVLRNSLNIYIMRLLHVACNNRKAQRDASTIALLRLKDDIDKYEGN